MNHPLRLVLVFHNHQPIGNFDGVFEQAYQDSYLPFLDVFERFEQLKIAIHTSGSLMEWLDAHHPEYVDRLAALVAKGKLEIVGGAYFEPILAMIPSRDRVGQITTYTQWLERRMGCEVRGMWMPERVWEQSMASDLVEAGIGYTILDDFHFKNAGLTQEQLHGYYVTEDDAQVISVLPGSEPLRYLLPFQPAHETIDYLRGVAEQHPGAVVVFGDDGEKFGTWPGTKEHVYDRGWLAQFFEALQANSDWLKVTTPAEAIDNVPPLGKLYIPEGSYREMTEWSLPSAKINEFEDAQHHLQDHGQWDLIKPFVRGGYWRNFKVKYPETNAMYARMQLVSRRLHSAVVAGATGELIDQARMELYRGQCNCSYWHGAFGGVYLPHLRNAVYQHLIAADNLLDQHENRGWQPDSLAWVSLDAADYNLDGRSEARLANNRLTAFVSPVEGGQIYELDVKSICHNLESTLTRRAEAYHRKVLRGPSEGGDGVASIHDQVIFKQEGLDERLGYDTWTRNSLVDHFYPADVSPQRVADGSAVEQGDFVHGSYDVKLRRSDDRVQLQLTREGNVLGRPIRITKGVTLNAAEAVLEVAYLLEDLPGDLGIHFAPEFNFAGLPSGADDRFFRDRNGNGLGQLGEQLDLHDVTQLGLVDDWLGIDVGLDFDRPTSIWTYPVETVSQSEGGFELVHQSVAVVPHWQLVPDVNGCWSVTIRMAIDTQVAESRMGEIAEVASLS
ncbi:MAG: alpha-amylase/4-alpha-glucanotransferase domain-containing protein [Planctomycetota bacterium]